MPSLFDKFTLLVNAQVNELLGRNPRSPLARISLNQRQANDDPRATAGQLRQRLEDAIAYEDELQAKIDRLLQEALDIDEQVDAALQAGDSAASRRLQGQLNAKQQQLSIAESELQDHRLVTRHLMQELNTLELNLDEQARHGTRVPVEGGGASSAPASGLASAANRVNEALGGIDVRARKAPARESQPTRFQIVDEEPDPRQSKPQGKDASDMKRRLSRLSGPDAD